ncbi:MAG: transcription termination/antitermination protein NusG [Pirellulaceae bacterium]
MASDPESRDEIAPEPSFDAPVAGESDSDAAPASETEADSVADDTETAEADSAEGVVLSVEESVGIAAAGVSGGVEEEQEEEENVKRWYILKVQVNREESIRRALERRVKIAGLERFFGDIVVPTEDVAEYNKNGKRRIVKKKLYPGYLMIHLALNDDTWFLVRETPGIGDFTGSAGKPTPMADHEVQRIVTASKGVEAGESPVKTAIPFKSGDRVRVKEGYFENFEGDIESIDEANGRVTVMINIFGRSTPVELEHWQMESI